MKLAKLLSIAVVALLAVGCSMTPQKPVPLENDFFKDNSAKIGIYIDTLPRVNTYFPGASCLLCIAAAEAANSDMTGHVQTLSGDEINEIYTIIEGILKKHSFSVVKVEDSIKINDLKSFSSKDEIIPYARKDFTPLKEKLGVDKLVIVDVNALGVYRAYSAYVPTTDPMGYIWGALSVVDLSDNQYNLYQAINIKTPVTGEWDEPKDFPGVTTAFYKSIEILKGQVKSLFNI